MDVIDAEGRTLMPGLIESHTHSNHCPQGRGVPGFETANWQRTGAMVRLSAEENLMNGFPTGRAMGVGSIAGGLKQVIDESCVEGSRIYPAGASFSQIIGQADFMAMGAADQTHANLYRYAFATIADGPDEMRNAM
ncbi:MAG: hypothetical protein R8G34_02535 [Paracoccaceae bacterium]|nr:hypothetical protein [Paracoccaceae bacterium]